MVDSIGEGTKFGRYALLDRIGTGGMAEIFRAKTFGAAGFEKEFAIKLILPSLVDDHEFVEMFINEAKIAVSLYHANIVQVFDLGEMDDQYYIAMEYVLGKDLLEILAHCAERNLKIPLDLVIFVTMEMLKGLSFAHRAKDPFGDDLNIIHRDVSPSNIMISYAGDVKVGDFGVAKAAIERTLTESGTLKGKVGYMSPEQVMGDEIDTRSDVFAAGVVFFEALSMSRLFVGDSDLDVMLKVRDADINESLDQADPLPQGLRSIVERALTKHREERFQTAGEFYQALVDFTYRHSLKVTGTDLSNFMRRLFADEIEEEKSRRRSEPKLDEIMDEADAAKAGEPTAAPESPPGDDPAAGADVPLSEPDESRSASADEPTDGPPSQVESTDPPSPNQVAEATVTPAAPKRYRYRDASGLIYGPMGWDTLTGLVSDEDVTASDRVSVDDGEWQKLSELDEHLAGRDDSDDRAAEPTADDAPTKRAPAPAESMGNEDTTLPENADLADQLDRAVSSLDEISNGLNEETARQSPGHLPFEISSIVDEVDGITETSAVNREAPEVSRGSNEVTTADDESSQRTFAEFKSQYASYEGELSQVPFARLLARLHRSDSTGRLHVQQGSVDKSIFVRDGEPILVDSNKKEELLGAFLLERGRISQDQLDEALARLSEWGGRLGDALVAIGAVEAHDIFELLGEQMHKKLLDVFTWPNGHYGYYENQEPDTVGYPLGLDTYSTIVHACREHIPLELIREYYQGRMRAAIFKAADPPVDIDRLELSGRELRVLTQLQAGANLRGLLDDTADDRRELVLRTIHLLHQVEVLNFEITDKLDLPGD